MLSSTPKSKVFREPEEAESAKAAGKSTPNQPRSLRKSSRNFRIDADASKNSAVEDEKSATQANIESEKEPPAAVENVITETVPTTRVIKERKSRSSVFRPPRPSIVRAQRAKGTNKINHFLRRLKQKAIEKGIDAYDLATALQQTHADWDAAVRILTQQ